MGERDNPEGSPEQADTDFARAMAEISTGTFGGKKARDKSGPRITPKDRIRKARELERPKYLPRTPEERAKIFKVAINQYPSSTFRNAGHFMFGQDVRQARALRKYRKGLKVICNTIGCALTLGHSGRCGTMEALSRDAD